MAGDAEANVGGGDFAQVRLPPAPLTLGVPVRYSFGTACASDGDSSSSLPVPPPPSPFPQVQELTQKNEKLVMALDAANRKVAELSAVLETGGNRLTAGVRESKIVEVSKKNRNLNLALEREKAEKQRALAQLKAANARLDENGKDRTESQVEAACREVVEEASKNAETAQKECAEWREKWKAATARAERFSGQKAYIKTENDRLKVIIRREIGEEVDFGNLDEAISATGGWKGRARQIRDLKMRCDVLKAQLADANDALKVLAAEPGSELDPVTAARRELDEARDALDRARDETAKVREKAKAGATRRRELEAETADLREKLAALKEKSDHDDTFVAALRSELDRANQRASMGAATGDFSGKSVPAAVYKSMEARAVAQEEKLREQDREMRTLRAAIASGDVLADTTSAAAIAAAAAGGDFSADDDDDAPDDASHQHEEDVANLIRHSETLERVCEQLRGKLVVAEKQVDQLRDQVQMERGKYMGLLARMESAGGETADRAEAAAANDAEMEALRARKESEISALRTALDEQKKETARVKAQSKEQIEAMEQEVELYVEMMEEMKKEAAKRNSGSGTATPKPRSGLPA